MHTDPLTGGRQPTINTSAEGLDFEKSGLLADTEVQAGLTAGRGSSGRQLLLLDLGNKLISGKESTSRLHVESHTLLEARQAPFHDARHSGHPQGDRVPLPLSPP